MGEAARTSRLPTDMALLTGVEWMKGIVPSSLDIVRYSGISAKLFLQHFIRRTPSLIPKIT